MRANVYHNMGASCNHFLYINMANSFDANVGYPPMRDKRATALSCEREAPLEFMSSYTLKVCSVRSVWNTAGFCLCFHAETWEYCWFVFFPMVLGIPAAFLQYFGGREQAHTPRETPSANVRTRLSLCSLIQKWVRSCRFVETWEYFCFCFFNGTWSLNDFLALF